MSQALHRINQLPAHLRDSEQRLCFYHAWALLFVGQFEECEHILERLLTLPNPLGWPVATYETVFKGYLTILDGRAADSLRQGTLLLEQALAQLAQLSNPDMTTLLMQGAAAVQLAFRYTFENEIMKAVILSHEAVRLNLKAGNTHAGSAATGLLAQLTCAQGHWQQAAGILKQGLAQLRWAQEEGTAVAEIVETMQQLAQLSPSAYVRQRLDAAVVQWQIRLVHMGDEWAYLRPEIQTLKGKNHEKIDSYSTEPRNRQTCVDPLCDNDGRLCHDPDGDDPGRSGTGSAPTFV